MPSQPFKNCKNDVGEEETIVEDWDFEPEEEEESADEESEEDTPDEEDEPDENGKKPPKDMVSFSYTPARTAASFMQKVSATQTGTPIAQLDKRLELLKY